MALLYIQKIFYICIVYSRTQFVGWQLYYSVFLSFLKWKDKWVASRNIQNKL